LPLQNDKAVKSYTVLKEELLKQSDIKSLTSGSSYPGLENILNSMLFYAEGKTVNDVIDVRMATVEDDYFQTLGLKILSGRPFSKEFTADSSGIILNESAIADLGYSAQTAVGKKVHYDFYGRQHTMQIVGVVKDFNYESLHNKIKPFGFATTFFANKYSYVIVKLNATNYSRALTAVEKTWSSVNPGIPFNYSFLDQDFQKNYVNDQRTSKIVIYFTFVAIVIACLGLFGLSAFSAEQRIKEIGIRKVLGASVTGITVLISKDFMKLVMLSLIIAVPVALWVMNKWLQNFAYRIQLEWWMFAVAGAIALIIALLTVSFQAIKAAISNPVKTLHYE
jgi:putative ABC transport system permease protein